MRDSSRFILGQEGPDSEESSDEAKNKELANNKGV